MMKIPVGGDTQTICVSDIASMKQKTLSDKRYRSPKFRGLLYKLNIDILLFGLLISVAILGCLLLYSASGFSSALLNRQIFNYFLGFAIMIWLAQVRMVTLIRVIDKLYILVIILLVVALFSSENKGSSRWVHLYFFNLQPSEFIKLFLPILLASVISKSTIPINHKTIFKSLLVIAVPAFLVYLQPDLGTTIIVVLSGVCILFFAGLSWKIISAAFLALSFIVPFVWNFGLHGYQKKRILTFLDPGKDPLGSGWNIMQSQTAIGSGGIFGKGYGQGTQAQLDFLPESHTDFIFAVLAEEQGTVGVLLLLFLYLCIIVRCCYIAIASDSLFVRLFVSSLTVIFFIYVTINIGMTSGILPVVGVPLPLVSYGGSSILSLMAGFGMIMAAHSKKQY